jgi:hypothetical protein
MVAQCGNCFFGRVAPTDSGIASALSCVRNAPNAQAPLLSGGGVVVTTVTVGWPWPLVNSDYWCGEYATIDPGVYGPIALGTAVVAASSPASFSAIKYVTLTLSNTVYFVPAATSSW